MQHLHPAPPVYTSAFRHRQSECSTASFPSSSQTVARCLSTTSHDPRRHQRAPRPLFLWVTCLPIRVETWVAVLASSLPFLAARELYACWKAGPDLVEAMDSTQQQRQSMTHSVTEADPRRRQRRQVALVRGRRERDLPRKGVAQAGARPGTHVYPLLTNTVAAARCITVQWSCYS